MAASTLIAVALAASAIVLGIIAVVAFCCWKKMKRSQAQLNNYSVPLSVTQSQLQAESTGKIHEMFSNEKTTQSRLELSLLYPYVILSHTIQYLYMNMLIIQLCVCFAVFYVYV